MFTQIKLFLITLFVTGLLSVCMLMHAADLEPTLPQFFGVEEGTTRVFPGKITITETTGANIYYTTNGTTPTTSATPYTTPISIADFADGPATIKAIAVNGAKESAIATCSFTVDLRPEPPTITGVPSAGEKFYGETAPITLESFSQTAQIFYKITAKNSDMGDVTFLENTPYTSPIVIPYDSNYLLPKIEAYCVQNGFSSSIVQSATINILPVQDLTQVSLNIEGIPANEIIEDATQSLTVSVTPDDAILPAIYYTLNGSDPTEQSLRYVDSIPTVTIPDGPTTLKVQSIFNENKSNLTTRTFTTALRGTTPTFSGIAQGETIENTSTTITLATTNNASIYYTLDGSPPDTTKTHYNAPITPQELGIDGPKTLRAVAVKNHFVSEELVLNFILNLTDPSISPPTFANIYNNETLTVAPHTVTISTLTEDADIYYTLDGSTPSSTNGTRGNSFDINTDQPDGTYTVKAIAVRGESSSEITTISFIRKFRPATPTITITPGPVNGTISEIPQNIVMQETTGATLYYTFDGSTPTQTESTTCIKYTAQFGPRKHWTTNGAKQLRVAAFRNGIKSTEATVSFNLDIFATAPIITLNDLCLYPINNAYTRGNVTITNAPGVNQALSYKVDNNALETYTGAINIKSWGNGTHTLLARSTHPTTGLTAETTQTISYCADDPTNNARWMDCISSNIKISQLSIPGTHESGATQGIAMAKCQSTGIRAQLDAGVRALDIRIYKDMSIYHGIIYMGKDLNDVMADIKNFLNDNPSEFLIISIKDENGSGGEQAWTDQVKPILQNTGKWAESLAPQDFTVQQLRGKFVIIRRYGYIYSGAITPGTWPDDWYLTSASGTPPLMIQDAYSYDGSVNSKIENKWTYITNFFNHARNNSINNGIVYLNYTSAVSGIFSTTPEGWANAINDRLRSWLQSNPKGRLGIIMMDFVGNDPDVPTLIYRSNKFTEL